MAALGSPGQQEAVGSKRKGEGGMMSLCYPRGRLGPGTEGLAQPRPAFPPGEEAAGLQSVTSHRHDARHAAQRDKQCPNQRKPPLLLWRHSQITSPMVKRDLKVRSNPGGWGELPPSLASSPHQVERGPCNFSC